MGLRTPLRKPLLVALLLCCARAELLQRWRQARAGAARSRAEPQRNRSALPAGPAEDGLRGTPAQACRICAHEDLNQRAAQGASAPSAPSDHLLLTIGDLPRYREGGPFRANALSWGCYGNRWGVPARAVDPKDVPGCQKQEGQWFFQRLCAMRTVLEALQQRDAEGGGLSRGALDLGLARDPEWVFHLDGDTVVLNGGLSPQALVRRWGGKDLVFYERFTNGEVMAGNYVARVSPLSARFLAQWEGWHAVARSSRFSNGDNGALHIQLVSFLRGELAGRRPRAGNASREVAHLRRLWRASTGILRYDAYVAAAKLALGPKRDFKHVLILRRGHGFCIDHQMAARGLDLNRLAAGEAARFLCTHGVKTPRQLARSVGQECVSEVEQCRQSVMTCTKPAVEEGELAHFIGAYRVDRMGLGQFNDVRDCWPDCPTDIPEEDWAILRKGLAENARCRADRGPFRRCSCGRVSCDRSEAWAEEGWALLQG